MNLHPQLEITGNSHGSRADKLIQCPDSQAITQELKCIACSEFPKPVRRLYTCKTGHLICGHCRKKPMHKNLCFICRGRWTKLNCLAVKNLLEDSLFTCRYKEEGCSAIIKGMSRKPHAKVCRYRPLTCNIKFHQPCTNNLVCTNQYLRHLMEFHLIEGQLPTFEDGNVFHLSLNPEQEEIIQISGIVYDGKEFLINSLNTNGVIYIWITLLDNSGLHLNDYQIHLSFDRGDINFHCTFSLPVYPPRTNFHTEMQKLRCAAVPHWSMENFFFVRGEDSVKLPFVCTIEKKNETNAIEG